MFARYQFSAAVSAPGSASRSIAASRSGWLAIHSRSSAQSSRRSSSSASGNWNSSMYHDFSRCATRRRAKPRGDRRESTASRSTRSGAISAIAHADAGAPVVADDVRRLDVQRVEDRDHVGDAVARRGRPRSSCGCPTSPKPRRSGAIGPEPASVERRDLVAPERCRVREAVQEQHRRAVALVGHRQLHTVAVDPPHDRAAYVVWSLLNTQAVETVRRHRHKHTCEGSETRERVVVRMAGDSGDGMQLAGSRFTDATAVFGNDLATLPDFPAEIRAPAGTVAGVSAFQIHFASRDILTPGDTPDVLVAMNPAALKANLGLMRRGATILVNEDAFSVRAVQKAGYADNPLEDGTLDGFTVKRIPMSSLTTRAVEDLEGVTSRDAQKAKNLFALGVLSWLYDRPTEVTEKWIRAKFSGHVMEANLAAFRAGWSFGETSELIDVQVKVNPQRRRRAGHLPQRQRHRGDGARADRRVDQERAAARLRRVPDHARVRPAARALAPAGHGRAHDPGRGRDRGRVDRARRGVRRRAGRHVHDAARGSISRPRRSGSR